MPRLALCSPVAARKSRAKDFPISISFLSVFLSYNGKVSAVSIHGQPRSSFLVAEKAWMIHIIWRLRKLLVLTAHHLIRL